MTKMTRMIQMTQTTGSFADDSPFGKFSEAHLPARAQSRVCWDAGSGGGLGAAPAQAGGHHRHRPVQDAEVCRPQSQLQQAAAPQDVRHQDTRGWAHEGRLLRGLW